MIRGDLPRWASACAALALAGCAGAGAGAPRSGAEWRELTTEHFVLRTDLAPELARRVAAALELDRALLVAAMPELAGVQRRLEVVAFASRQEFGQVTGQRTDYVGLAYHDASGGQWVAILVSATGDAEEHAIELTHELAHALTRQVIPRQPAWLSEGLAQYLSSVAVVTGGRRYLGIPEGWLGDQDYLPSGEVLAWRTSGHGGEGRLYASALRLVRYLSVEEPGALAELERRLAAGEPEDLAWNAAFPRFPRTPAGMARLDRALWPWEQSLPGTWREVSAAASAGSTERVLGAAEVDAIRSRLRRSGAEGAREVDPTVGAPRSCARP